MIRAELFKIPLATGESAHSCGDDFFVGVKTLNGRFGDAFSGLNSVGVRVPFNLCSRSSSSEKSVEPSLCSWLKCHSTFTFSNMDFLRCNACINWKDSKISEVFHILKAIKIA